MDGRGGTAESYLRNYRLGKTLGHGSFGKVKIAEHIQTGHKVAIKVLNRRRMRSPDMVEKVRREIKICRLFVHPHVIRIYEVIETPADIYVVMEYVTRGELFDYIVEKGRLREDEARHFFQQIISGVEYCHRNMVVHRDLKPENLLLDSKGNVKIADFGLSNIMRDGHFLRTSCGSPNYAAPEVVSGKLYAGPEVDVWSCGVILYALLCGALPFDDENIPNLFKKIKSGLYTLPSHLSSGARDLIPRMLVVDPIKRITTSEIRQHLWFKVNLPRYLAVTPPNATEHLKKLDDDIIQDVLRMGYDRSQLIESLQNRLQNDATVAYYLLFDKRCPVSTGYLAAEFQETMEHYTVEPCRDANSHGFPPDGSVIIPRSRKQWLVGLQSAARPRDIMAQILVALQRLNVRWKRIGHYNMKCLLVQGIPDQGSVASVSHLPDSQYICNGISPTNANVLQRCVMKFEMQVLCLCYINLECARLGSLFQCYRGLCFGIIDSFTRPARWSICSTCRGLVDRQMGFDDSMDRQIQDLAEKIEDLMESHLSSSDYDGDGRDGDSVFAAELVKVKEGICSFVEVVGEKIDSGMQQGLQRGHYLPTDEAVSSMIARSGLKNRKLVGLDGEIKNLLDCIIPGVRDGMLMTIPVVGMVGIGKTTLVKQVYNHPLLSTLFETRIMVRVGPFCSSRDLMLLVLDRLGFQLHENLSKKDLKAHLLEALTGKRFMIVLDDVWSTFDAYKSFEKIAYKEGVNGGLIIFTATQWGIAKFGDIHYEKQFLSDEDSWKLLHEMVFGNSEEPCSCQLEKIGKKIAKNCEGLPLAIISIGELLSKVERTVECWMKISEDENPWRIGVDNSTPIAKSLLLSYEMLCYRFQMCLLHVGVFPRGYEIIVANLIELWLAEGFFRVDVDEDADEDEDDEDLENIAKECLSNLVRRSVVLVPKLSSNQQFKTCRVHVIFRNLCINMAQSKKFCYVMKKYTSSFPQGTNRQQRLCIHNNVMLSIK